jgi:hypothetical protein
VSYVDRIINGQVVPWVGSGVDGCRRSADVANEELGTLAVDDPRFDEVLAQREAWKQRAGVEES